MFIKLRELKQKTNKSRDLGAVQPSGAPAGAGPAKWVVLRRPGAKTRRDSGAPSALGRQARPGRTTTND